jgi:hypothetical protein
LIDALSRNILPEMPVRPEESNEIRKLLDLDRELANELWLLTSPRDLKRREVVLRERRWIAARLRELGVVDEIVTSPRPSQRAPRP